MVHTFYTYVFKKQPLTSKLYGLAMNTCAYLRTKKKLELRAQLVRKDDGSNPLTLKNFTGN